MNRILYSLLLYLITPLVLLRLLWRSRALPAYRQRIGERFGFYRQPVEPVMVWIHAVSVGEFMATIPLIERLQQPSVRILVTTMTPTGSARVVERFQGSVEHCYLPYDLPGAVSRFLDHFRPSVGVVMETELWPNLFHGCSKRGVPVILANVRLSQRSMEGYQHYASRLVAETLQQVGWIAAQGEADRTRLLQLGAESDKVSVTGSIKFDMTIPESIHQQGETLKQELGDGRLIWIAASTREGEEVQILQAHRMLLQQIPDVLLLLVPRHPERFDSVAKLVQGQGLGLARRSRQQMCDTDTQVYLGDTMGELLLLYAASDVAFVGGSLVPTGSHNMLEPAALGKPVLFGPHRFNFSEISQLLLECGAALEVIDAQQLAVVLGDLLSAPQRREQMGAVGSAVVTENRGAVERLYSGLMQYLPSEH